MLIGTHPRLRHATSEWAIIQAITPETPVYGFVGKLLGAAAGFGWLDARLWRDGWLEVLTAEDLAVYAFLCLVADRQGVSKKVPAYR